MGIINVSILIRTIYNIFPVIKRGYINITSTLSSLIITNFFFMKITWGFCPLFIRIHK